MRELNGNPTRTVARRSLCRLAFCAVNILLASSLLNAHPVRAEIVDCQPADATVYNIFIDEVRPFDSSTPPTSAESQVRNALSLALSDSLETLSATTKESLKQNTCRNRYPTMSDFTKDIVDPLDSRKVVLELWGTVLSGRDHIAASFNLVLIPAQLRYLSLHEPPSGLLEIRRDVSLGSSHRLSDVLERNDEIKGYALIGAGLKAYDEMDYAAANSYLCAGETTLLSSFKLNPNPAADELLSYVRALGDRIYKEAQSTPGSNNRLKLLGPGKQSLSCRLK